MNYREGRTPKTPPSLALTPVAARCPARHAQEKWGFDSSDIARNLVDCRSTLVTCETAFSACVPYRLGRIHDRWLTETVAGCSDEVPLHHQKLSTENFLIIYKMEVFSMY